jgi:hypothetical protein
MTLESLSSLLALILAISLASERLVTIVKTALPWLNTPARTVTGEEDDEADRPRRLLLQLLALAGAWVTSWLVATGDALQVSDLLLGKVPYTDGKSLPVWLVAVLGSGGSAFWAQILAYTRAAREIRQQDAAATTNTRVLVGTQTIALQRATQLLQPETRDRERETLQKVVDRVHNSLSDEVAKTLGRAP